MEPVGREGVESQAAGWKVAAVMGVAFMQVVDTHTMSAGPCGATAARLR
jgi:hypothetical protein